MLQICDGLEVGKNGVPHYTSKDLLAEAKRCSPSTTSRIRVEGLLEEMAKKLFTFDEDSCLRSQNRTRDLSITICYYSRT